MAALKDFQDILRRISYHIQKFRKEAAEKSLSCKALDSHIQQRNIAVAILHQFNGGLSVLNNVEIPPFSEFKYENSQSPTVEFDNLTIVECNELKVKLFQDLKVVKEQIAFFDALNIRQRNVFVDQVNLINNERNDLINFAWSSVMPWVQNKGIINVYSICYASTVLQALFHIPQLVHWLLNFPLENQNNPTQHLPIRQTVNLLRTLRSGQEGNIISLLMSMPNFLSQFPLGEQHDSPEFLRTLFELFEKQIGNKSPFPAIFNFGVKNVLACSRCNYTSTTLLWESGIDLDLFNDNNIKSLLINQFFKEKLDSYCPDCKELIEFSKTLNMTEFPQFLIIKLKRFTQIDERTFQKNNAAIQIPTSLDMTAFNLELSHPKYKLSSMILHYSLTDESVSSKVESNHYVFIVWSPVKNQWIKYNDSNVPEIYNFDEMDLSHPLILFYKRCSVVESNELDNDFCAEEPITSHGSFPLFHDNQHQFVDAYGEFMYHESEDEEADEDEQCYSNSEPEEVDEQDEQSDFEIAETDDEEEEEAADNQHEEHDFEIPEIDDEEEADEHIDLQIEDRESQFHISEIDEKDKLYNEDQRTEICISGTDAEEEREEYTERKSNVEQTSQTNYLFQQSHPTHTDHKSKGDQTSQGSYLSHPPHTDHKSKSDKTSQTNDLSQQSHQTQVTLEKCQNEINKMNDNVEQLLKELSSLKCLFIEQNDEIQNNNRFLQEAQIETELFRPLNNPVSSNSTPIAELQEMCLAFSNPPNNLNDCKHLLQKYSSRMPFLVDTVHVYEECFEKQSKIILYQDLELLDHCQKRNSPHPSHTDHKSKVDQSSQTNYLSQRSNSSHTDHKSKVDQSSQTNYLSQRSHSSHTDHKSNVDQTSQTNYLSQLSHARNAQVARNSPVDEGAHRSEASGNNVIRQQSQVEEQQNEQQQRRISSSRNPSRQCKRKQIICDSDSDEPYPRSELSYHPPEESADESDQSMVSISKPSPFRRHAPARVTPTNIKKVVRSRNDTPVPVDKFEKLNLTKLQRKKPSRPVDQQDQLPSSSFANVIESIMPIGQEEYRRGLFTAEQEVQVQQMVNEKRGTRRALPAVERKFLLNKINADFQLNLTDEQFAVWIKHTNSRKRRKGTRPTLYTKEHFAVITELRASVPPTSWPEIQKILAKKFDRFEGLAHQVISKQFRIHNKDKRKGEWSDGEEQLLLDNYVIHGRNWSRYPIPNRTGAQIRQKFELLMIKSLNLLNGKSFRRIVADAFDCILENEGDEVTVSNEQWFDEVCNKVQLQRMSVAMTQFAFKNVVSRLLKDVQVVRTNIGYAKAPPKEQRQYILQERKKLAPRQPIGVELNVQQEQHIRKLMNETLKQGKSKQKFQWFEKPILNVIATTPMSPDDGRRLDFRPVGESFKEDRDRRSFTTLLCSDEDEDEEEEEEEEQQQELNDVVHINELMDVQREKREHGINFVGALHFKHSLKYPEQSAKRLIFYTCNENVYDFIFLQLSNTLRRLGCPSWHDAFVVHQLEIDWGIIDVLAYAEGVRASMRLKLFTVKVSPQSVFNVRKGVFCPLVGGLEEYLKRLAALNYVLNDQQLAVNERDGEAFLEVNTKSKKDNKSKKNKKPMKDKK